MVCWVASGASAIIASFDRPAGPKKRASIPWSRGLADDGGDGGRVPISAIPSGLAAGDVRQLRGEVLVVGGVTFDVNRRLAQFLQPLQEDVARADAVVVAVVDLGYTFHMQLLNREIGSCTAWPLSLVRMRNVHLLRAVVMRGLEAPTTM